MIALRLDDGQLRRYSAELVAVPERVAARAPGFVRHWGQLLETQVKRNASTGFHAPGEPHIPGTGPGPNVATADYLRTITAEFFHDGQVIGSSVGSNDIRTRRLEFGFIDHRTGGRHTVALAESRGGGPGLGLLGAIAHGGSGHPYPHFNPALDLIEPRFVAAAEALGAAELS